MMMMPPKKKAATLILGMMGPKSPEGQDVPAGGEGGDDDQVALDSVAEDILKAVAQKNPKALSAALSHFFYICDKDEEESPEEESKEGE